MSTRYTMEYVEFPYFLFDYKTDSLLEHTGEQEIRDEVELRAVFEVVIEKAMFQQRKLVILDMWNNVLFHAEHGVLIFPTRAHAKTMKEAHFEYLEW